MANSNSGNGEVVGFAAERYHPGRLARLAGPAGLGVLALTFGASLLLRHGMRQFWFAYLLNFAFFLTLTLGALAFVMIQHVTRAGWSVVVRRVSEVLGANITTLALLFIPILAAAVFGRGVLYAWTSPTWLNEHQEFAHRSIYPNLALFLVRCAIYFAVWIGLARYFYQRSLEQDLTGDASLTFGMRKLSAPGLVLLGLTMTFAAFDLLMSLSPEWISTMYGIYVISGSLVGVLALLILVTTLARSHGSLGRAVTSEHFHDLGKLQFAFVFFWGYIAFSQYMLIWYANLPEETSWLLRRGMTTDPADVTPWSYVSLALLFGHLLIPFAALLSRFAKRRPWLLAFWALWLLATHWFDLFWLVAPEYQPDRPAAALSPTFIALSIGCLAGLALVYASGAIQLAAGRATIPVRDPRLPESLRFQNA